MMRRLFPPLYDPEARSIQISPAWAVVVSIASFVIYWLLPMAGGLSL